MAKSKVGEQAAVAGAEIVSQRGRQRSRQGIVVSNKMTKTVVVEITRRVAHAKYGKYITKRSTCLAHDERGECGVGDTVRVVESRPLSRLKHWRVDQIIARAV